MGAFMLSMLPILKAEEWAFISEPLEVIKDTLQTSNKISLHTRVSMEDLDKHFAEDHEAIVAFRVNGDQPHQVSVPKGLEWKKFKRFEEFVAAVKPNSFRSEVPPA
jgi:hypothetical protein